MLLILSTMIDRLTHFQLDASNIDILTVLIGRFIRQHNSDIRLHKTNSGNVTDFGEV